MTEDDRGAHRRRVARSVGALRASRGMSRRDLAEASGLSYPYVSQIENGDREPSMKALSALAGALGVELGALTSAPDVWMAAPMLADMAPDRAFTNPDYRSPEKPAGRRSSRPTDVESAVAQAHRALSLLTPEERLDAVLRLVRAVVPEVVEEQARDRRGGRPRG